MARTPPERRESTAGLFVASFVCHVNPEKRAELLASLVRLMDRTRWLPGCLGCRLVAATEDPGSLTLIQEWSSHSALDWFLRSAEYRILKGMRFLMDEEPGLAVDEVVNRARISLESRDD
jgi:quinol monooxygenase YgiN